MELDDEAWDVVAERLLEVATAEQGIGLDALLAEGASAAGLTADDVEAERAVSEVFENLLGTGELALLYPDRVVVPEQLVDGAVFTHLLTAADIDQGSIAASADLAPIVAVLAPWEPEDGVTPLAGPLEHASAGASVAIEVSAEASGVEALKLRLGLADPVDSAVELVAAFRAAYDAEVAEPGLPVGVAELVWHALLADGQAFAQPRPPLTAICEAAGLEVRGYEVADDDHVWRRGRLKPLFHAILDQSMRDERLRSRAVAALAAIEDDFAGEHGAAAVFDAFAIDHVLELFREVLVDEADDGYGSGDRLEDAARLAEVLAASARKPFEVAMASYWRAAVLEGRGRPLEALTHLEAAVRKAPEWPPALKRLAWYRSDMGDADAAIRLLSRVASTDEGALDMIELLGHYSARATAGAQGRNDPCWCGSGRKYKVCHLGSPVTAALPDRVSWLLEKLVAFADHNSAARDGTYHIVAVLAGPDAGRAAFAEAAADPLVPDVLFFGLGRLRDFLALRGELLPADERDLAERWLESRRTLVEVEEVDPGVGMRVKDLATADRYDVREVTFTQNVRVGTVWCARVVPDGESHQIIFGLWPIPAGRERDWLDMLDRDDPFELLAWRSAAKAPPLVVTPDGEVLEFVRWDKAGLPAAPLAEHSIDDSPAAMSIAAEWRDRYEERWCDEPVPALGGLTPRQAAADPVARETLERLLLSFPEPPKGTMASRPSRLRELLDL